MVREGEDDTPVLDAVCVATAGVVAALPAGDGGAAELEAAGECEDDCVVATAAELPETVGVAAPLPPGVAAVDDAVADGKTLELGGVAEATGLAVVTPLPPGVAAVVDTVGEPENATVAPLGVAETVTVDE